MSACDRFEMPSSAVGLKGLLRPTRTAVGLALALALVIHGSLIALRTAAAQRRALRPLTTHFVKRSPRLTKPLELKKHPTPKQRTLRRKMVTVQAKLNRHQSSSSIRAVRTIQGLARPAVTMTRSPALAPGAQEPEALAEEIAGARESKQVADMSLELLDVEVLDTGKYQAMVIQDPADRRNIRGYFHLCPVYIPSAADAEARSRWGFGSAFPFPSSLRNLVGALNKYTDIQADVGQAFSLDSQSVFKVPIIFVSSHVPFATSPAEARSAGEYLEAGGFLFSDTLSMNARVVYPNMRALWRASLASVGKVYGVHWDFERVPRSHAIYHCYFDFEGPPAGLDNFQPNNMPPADYLDGVFTASRLLGICTSKNYWQPWSDWHRINEGADNTRALQFGVNIIIFALTQEGSITNRVMDAVQ